MTIDYKAKCEHLTAVIESAMADLVGQKMINREDVYDKLHAAIYSDQFDEDEIMSKELKPQIRRGGQQDDMWAWENDGSEPKWLCLPLTPASRKAMVEEMFHAFILCPTNNYRDMAKAALAALEKMALKAKSGEKA